MPKIAHNPELKGEGKERKRAIEALGIKVLGWVRAGTHLKFTLELPGGRERTLVCPLSCSDHRGIKNMVSMLKRWLKESDTP